MKHTSFFFASLMVFTFGGALSASAQTPCAYYGGHVDIEGKFGSRRDIGETSIFIPVACKRDELIFTDIRFKGDDNDNREGNLGLGFRALKTQGVLGGYAYFDRKKSGLTDKYHSQVTVGGEWLAENWEMRANGYVPITPAVEKNSSSNMLSNPFLFDSGIYVRETAAQQTLRETALYGGDIEAGFKVPDTALWLHAGLYSFNHHDAPSLDGARMRATFHVTNHIALTAEGQYDDERKEQGWLGARITIPFGAPAQKPEGLATRMTASPVRDVDIVTQTQASQTFHDALLPVINIQSGQAQRVLYVDNSSTGGGDGSLERPFNTLIDAQAQLAQHDILYIASGLGNATNMQDGLTVNVSDVQVIGSGSDFVYDGNRMTVNQGQNFTGTMLRQATTAPIITNTGGDGMTITASNVLVSGLVVDGAAQNGIHIVNNGTNLDNITLHNVRTVNNTGDGIRIHADGANSYITAALFNVTAASNQNGIRFYANNDASVAALLQSSFTTLNYEHGVIVYDDSVAGSVNADLGGGGRSLGNNAFYGNRLEDLSVDIDGDTLFARHNWWGQDTGLYQAAPDGTHKPQIYYGAPINDGLVAHWTFDEEWTSDTTLFDRSGNNINGTLMGGLSLANLGNGARREAMTFNGTSQYIEFGDVLDLRDNDMTLLSMLNTNFSGANNRYIISKSQASGTPYRWGVGVRADTGRVNSFFKGAGSSDSTPQGDIVNDGAWHDSAILYDRSAQVSLVTDGTQDVTANISQWNNQDFDSNNPLRIGSYTAANNVTPQYFYAGQLDDIRIYHRLLSTNELNELARMNTTSIVDSSSYLMAAP